MKNAGKTQSEIVKLLKMSKTTVLDAIKQYKELGTSLDCSRKRKTRHVVTDPVTDKVRYRIKRNPRQSMRKMAKSLNIIFFHREGCQGRCQRVPKEDIKRNTSPLVPKTLWFGYIDASTGLGTSSWCKHHNRSLQTPVFERVGQRYVAI